MNFKLSIISHDGNYQKEEVLFLDKDTYRHDKEFKAKVIKYDDEARALTTRWNADGETEAFAYVNIELAEYGSQKIKLLKEVEIFLENLLDDHS